MQPRLDVSTLLAALLPAMLAVGPPAPAAEHPNVVLIMTDDQGYGDVRSHGNDLIDTPVQDALAASGARFDRFFVSPVCAPTRASLLTGRYHLRTGVHGVTRAYETMRAEEVTLAEVFKQAGYATGCFGKWHNGAHYPQHPNGQGFDEFVGFCAGHWNNYFDTRLEHNGRYFTSKGYINDFLTDTAIRFIGENRAGPFFCYVPYNTPHSPFQAPDRYFDKYKARGLDDTLACVYAMCENIDDNLGRILQTLDELKLAENTIVLFLTDNGANTDRYNAGMKGRKGSLHEGGSRVPLFVRWPGRIRPETEIKNIASHIDLLPTLVELCGVPMPRTLPLDGKSLVPLLEGRGDDWPDRTILTHWGGDLDTPNRGAVRTQRYRAVLTGQRWELYDMLEDPGQKTDLAKQQPELLEELRGRFEALFADVTAAGFDPIPAEIGHPERPLVRLPGHEAILVPDTKEGISYVGRNGWANDWVTNWTTTQAYPYWDVDVVRPGKYEIALGYACAESNAGAKIRLEVAGQTLDATVAPPFVPETIPSPDRVDRGEVYERTWGRLPLGILELPQGPTKLAVKALSIPGEQVMDLKTVFIQRID
jgi:arylsulfatase A